MLVRGTSSEEPCQEALHQHHQHHVQAVTDPSANCFPSLEVFQESCRKKKRVVQGDGRLDEHFRSGYQDLGLERCCSCFTDTCSVQQTALGAQAQLSVSISSRLADRFCCWSQDQRFCSTADPQHPFLWAMTLVTINC